MTPQQVHVARFVELAEVIGFDADPAALATTPLQTRSGGRPRTVATQPMGPMSSHR